MADLSAGITGSTPDNKIPVSAGSQPRSDALPPKPKYRSKNGLTSANGKDYNIIKKVEGMNRTRSMSRGGRSSSRTKNYIDRGRETDRMMDTKSSELGGVLTRTRSSSKQRPESRGPMAFLSRGRSSSRQDSEIKSSDSKSHRSRSRMGKGILKKMRSLSRIRKPSQDTEPRGRSSSRGGDRVNEYSERPISRGRRREAVDMPASEMPPRPNARRTRMTDQEGITPRDDNMEERDMQAHLPPVEKKTIERVRAPCSSSASSNDEDQDANNGDVKDKDQNAEHEDANTLGDRDVQAEPEPRSTPESDDESDHTEEDPDALSERDVMKLDSKNSQMHIACLLHYPSKDIVCQLQLDNSLCFKANSAGELPLHYAMMDKKGVNDEVLLTLLQLNPDAVQYPNSHRSLPIHLACLSGGGNKDAVRALLSICPDSVMVRSKYPIPFEQDMLDNINNNDPEAEDEGEKQPQTAAANNSFLDMFSYGAQAPPPPPQPVSEKKKTRKLGCVDDELTRGKQMYETGWTPLHLAVLNGAESAVIQLIVSANPQCVFVKTNRGRMAIDCAQYMIRQHWLYGDDDEITVQKTFAAIELLEETAIDYR